MLKRLRRALLASAAGRYLAMDLAEVHGEQAADVLEKMLIEDRDDPERRAVLLKARRALRSIDRTR